MLKVGDVFIVFFLTAVLSGCVSQNSPVKPVEAPQLADAAKYTIAVYIDAGVCDSMSERQANQRIQLSKWMENDLLNILRKRGGYRAYPLTVSGQFTSDEDTYLLALIITRYERRYRFRGANWAAIDVRLELYDDNEQPLLSREQSVETQLDWKRCARTVNEYTQNVVASFLADGKQR